MTTNQIKPLSLVIIGGFLGSGKTTLLKRLLDWELSQGQKPVVVMSEFGGIDIDSTYIDNDEIEVRKLSGGCVCCDLRLSLTTTLEEISRKSPGAHVYLETTGVADPAGVLEAIAPVANKGLILVQKVILVYDASLGEAMQEDRYMAERQLLTADVILVNRSDTVTPSEVDRVFELLASIKPQTPLYRTSYCEIDPAKLMSAESSAKDRRDAPIDSSRYVSVAFTLDKPLNREYFEKWLKDQTKDVLRIKGFVNFTGENGLYEVQTVRGVYSITPFPILIRQRAVLVAIAHRRRAAGIFKPLQEYAGKR